MELVTFKDLKSLLGLEESSISSYPALGVIKSSVEDAIEDYLGRSLARQERTETFYPSYPQRNFVLNALPIQSIASITVDGEEVTDDDYKRSRNGFVLTTGTECEVVVTYTGGLTEETLPSNIRRAALYQVAYEWQQKDIIGSETVTTDQGTVKKPGFKLLEEVKDILDAHLHPMRV